MSEWISVNEGLPKELSRVLCYKAKTVNGKNPDHWWQYNATIYSSGFHVNNPAEVTHWMPLPEPPK